jgi:hypothetical protein
MGKNRDESEEKYEKTKDFQRFSLAIFLENRYNIPWKGEI